MRVAAYRVVFAVRGVPSFAVFILLARVPALAAGMTVTMHVLLGLEGGYGAAGLVAAASTMGMAAGAPFMGRFTDRRGLRAMLVVSVSVSTAFWLVAPGLPLPLLMACCFAAGLVVLPLGQLGRLVLTALVPPSVRQAALALDSMGVELAFMAGPALGILLTLRYSSQTAMWSIGAAMLVFGALLYAMNPPIRAADADGTTEAVPRKEWLTAPLMGVLVAASGVTFVITGVEVALLASMRELGVTGWTGVMIALMCAASIAGGFVYGGLRRVPPVWLAIGVMGACALPIGLAAESVWMLAVAVVPASLLCAPAIARVSGEIVQLAPASARGEAMGLQGSAFTIGAALGAPLCGVAIDGASSAWGYVAAGVGGVLLACVALVMARSVRAVDSESVRI